MSNSKRREPWRSQERHHCSVCNVWMGSDRQSILLHEQGRKHQENAAKALADKRQARAESDKAAAALKQALGQMQQAAVEKHLGDVHRFGDSALHALAAPTTTTGHQVANNTAIAAASMNANATVKQVDKKQQQEEKEAWESRKKKRQATKKGSSNDEDGDSAENPVKKVKRHLAPDEGHYTIDKKTYLEATSFGEILETDMPIDLWLGPLAASHAEQRLLEKQHLWKPALVARVRKGSTTDAVDVAYLKHDEEQIEKSVPFHRIRIVLGGDALIPDTLEEARVAAMGGQIVVQVAPAAIESSLDENTGFTSWGTVEIRQTTERTEWKEERERARQVRKAERERREGEEKRAQGRRMEEARVENAQDSALGAYDVWNAGKEGYKGVEIHKEEKLTAADIAAPTGVAPGASGVKVEFKKKGFKSKGKKRNARKTSADDL